MKPLVLTAAIALTLGALTLLVAGFTWPTWDAADAYDKARITAEYVGAEEPSPLEYLTAPAGHYTGHIVALAAGSLLTSIGVLAGLFALHARAIREAVFSSASSPVRSGFLGS